MLASAAGAAQADVFFKTPSGNIGCAYDNVAGARLVCLIYEPKVTAAILTVDGVDASGPPETWDRSWAAPGVPVLAYGKTRKLGPFTCTSAKSGLTCKGKAHGFTMSRASIKAY
jgi:hypothetical protein